MSILALVYLYLYGVLLLVAAGMLAIAWTVGVVIVSAVRNNQRD